MEVTKGRTQKAADMLRDVRSFVRTHKVEVSAAVTVVGALLMHFFPELPIHEIVNALSLLVGGM